MQDWTLADLFPYVAEPVLSLIIQDDQEWLFSRLFPKIDKGLRPKNVTVVTRAALQYNPANVSFDGCHTVDIGLILEDEAELIPVEVKAGKTNLRQSNFDEMLSECRRSRHSQRIPRIAGNMLAILNRQFDPELQELIGKAELYAVTSDRRTRVSTRWALIARREIIDQLEQRNFTTTGTLISLEDLCSQYGRSKFNAKVEQMLDSEDYYRDWIEHVSLEPDDEIVDLPGPTQS